MAEGKRIVVGVDGSEGSHGALQWAFEEAREDGSELLLVSVWTPPPTEIAPPFGSFPWGTNVDLSGAAEQALQEMLQSVAADRNDVTVKTQVASGNAAKVLIDLSQDADLLVVGSVVMAVSPDCSWGR
jgi:nucleotide-binding universal stress UspA family protein